MEVESNVEIKINAIPEKLKEMQAEINELFG